MTHDEKREAVARAIWRETYRHDTLMEWHEIKKGTMHHKRVLAAADAILALPPATSDIGADMVLVPRVPTGAMKRAGGLAFNPDEDVTVVSSFEAGQAWSAMLAASPSALSAGTGVAPRAGQFIGWIADRFIEKHATPLDRDRAIAMAVACLDFTEDSAPFGHVDFAWTRDGAIEIADAEIDCWESAA